MKTPCETCGGTGQVSYFKGVSRFLLSSEECPECSGFGYIVSDNGEKPVDSSPTDNKRSGRSRKKKQ